MKNYVMKLKHSIHFDRDKEEWKFQEEEEEEKGEHARKSSEGYVRITYRFYQELIHSSKTMDGIFSSLQIFNVSLAYTQLKKNCILLLQYWQKHTHNFHTINRH